MVMPSATIQQRDEYDSTPANVSGKKRGMGKISLRPGANWLWGNFDKITLLAGWAASFALPAWAVKMTGIMSQYEPFSWVVAGFSGAMLAVIAYAIAAFARGKFLRAKYDSRMLAQGGFIDPLEKTFERKRIYLNEFCLPSHPFVENKAFIDCELIGPANIIFLSGNSITDARYPIVDAIYMEESARPTNGYIFKDCIFRGCNFSRVTFLVQHEETNMFRSFSLVNWLTVSPNAQTEMNFSPAIIDGQPQHSVVEIDEQI